MSKVDVCEANRKKYKVPGGNSYMLRSKNAIFISSANTLKHEMMKLVIAYSLRKWGDFKITDEVRESLEDLQYRVELAMKDFSGGKKSFITECQSKEFPDKRRDMVILDTGQVVEIETTERRAKRFKDDPDSNNIIVVMT